MEVFRVKICGVTSVEDAEAVAACGADAIGLNFYTGSPRGVTEDTARRIADAVRGSVGLVGVFVNHTPESIQATAGNLGLDYVQLHGDEPLECLGELVGLEVIRAFRCKEGDLTHVSQWLRGVKERELSLSAVLIDAHHPGHYGGTGTTTDWNAVRDARDLLDDFPVVLAGGLRPENVARAISVARPTAVDAASGVEQTVGKKSPDKIARFVDSALAAFGNLTQT